MRPPTAKQMARMVWVRKAVHMDGTTRGGFRWPVGVGGWVEQDGPADGQACGVGLHLGKTFRGLSSAHRLSESVLLAVGYLPGDVLGEDGDKVRVRRCFVLPGVMCGLPKLARETIALRGAVLRDATLGGATLRDADLGGADLGGATLRDATLRDANLWGADLRCADLRCADLGGATLRYANLRDADLRDADLRGANLRDADLRGATLGGADLRGAVASTDTRWPAGFDAVAAGVVVR